MKQLATAFNKCHRMTTKSVINDQSQQLEKFANTSSYSTDKIKFLESQVKTLQQESKKIKKNEQQLRTEVKQLTNQKETLESQNKTAS